METSTPGATPSDVKVLIGIPTYNGDVASEVIDDLFHCSKDTPFTFCRQGGSLLAMGFNNLLCEALNHRKLGITHFVLHHADIGLEPQWLDKMMSIYKEKDADILSVVIPIKNEEGLTSTALDEDIEGRSKDACPRRLTMHEIFRDFPRTFTAPNLLLNTGVMMFALDKPWLEGMCFRMEDRIIQNQDGKYLASTMPEDWLFSRDARRRGATKLYATREVGATHFGRAMYPNTQEWGTSWQDAVKKEDRKKKPF